MDLPTLIAVLSALLIIGLFAGFLAGLLGVGGGIVLVPAFFYVFQFLGYDSPDIMQVCLATSLATIVVTSMRSLQSHHKTAAVDWEILRQWAPGIVVGAIIGVFVAARLNSTVLQIIFGGLGVFIGLYLAFGKLSWVIGEQMPQGPVQWALSGGVGFLSVLLGIGGGSLGVPLMTLHKIAIHRAVATAAGFGLAIAATSVVVWVFVPISAPAPPLMIGAINVPAFAIIVPMTFLMAPVGARVAHAMNPKPLMRLFGIFLLIVTLNMLRTALSG